jgi:hypothetical protein
MSSMLDQAPADLLATATSSSAASRTAGRDFVYDARMGSSATGEDVSATPRRLSPALLLRAAAFSTPSRWTSADLACVCLVCMCAVCCRVCVRAPPGFRCLYAQLEGMVQQALHLVRGNLSVEILSDQACVFLGSVDGEGKPDGQGVATNRSAQREERNEYRGDFQGGARHGIGVVKFGDGTTYQGEWVLDHPKGYGVELYPDGGVFKGRFWNDARHGLGAYYFANGQRYFGRWNTGVRHGEGVEMGKSGEKFFSVFEM